MNQREKERVWEYQVNRKSLYVPNCTGIVCPITWVKKKKMARANESHHRLSNTKTNRHCFPLVVDSMLSRLPVEGGMHKQYPSFGNIAPYKALRMQRFLERHKPFADFVNGKTVKLGGPYANNFREGF